MVSHYVYTNVPLKPLKLSHMKVYKAEQCLLCGLAYSMNPITLIVFMCAGISCIKCASNVESVGNEEDSSGSEEDSSPNVTPTSDIPTISTWGYDETKKHFDFIRTKPSTGIDHFKNIVLNNNVPENLSNLETWNTLLTLGSEEYDGAQWMQYYMVVEALDQGKFGLALGIMKVLLPDTADSDSISEEIRELMRGNPGGAYEGILTRLIKAQNQYKVGDGNGDVEALRLKFTEAAYYFDQSDFLDANQKFTNMTTINWANIARGMRKSLFDGPITESIDENVANDILAKFNTAYVYAVIIQLSVKDLKGLINDIIAFGNTELVNVAMVKLTSHDPGVVNSLAAERQIWNYVKTGIVAKLLRKFDVPIICGRDYKMARRAVYSIENEKERHAILRQLKFDNNRNSADKIAHDNLFKSDKRLTMREALMLKNSRLVEAMFARSSLTPDPKWIIFAIKFSDKVCLKVLLEERVPLPEESELAKAYGMAAFSGAKETVDSYRAKYRELQSVLELDASAPPVIYDGSVGGELWAVTHRADPAPAAEPAPALEPEVRNTRSTNNNTTTAAAISTATSNDSFIDEDFKFDSEGAFPDLDAFGNAEIEIYFELRRLYLAGQRA